MLKKFIEDNKHEEWFRPAAILIILLVIALGVGLFDEIKYRLMPEETEIVESADSDAKAEDEKESDGNFLTDFIYENKTHIILIIGITAALGVVEYKKKAALKLKER